MARPGALVVLFVAAAALVACSPRADTAPATATEKDALVLEQLKSAGSDLSRPHAAEFFLYLPTETAARAVAERYSRDGFTADVHPAPMGSDWSCVLRKSLILDLDTLRVLRRDFTEVSAAYAGEYDGWGAEVEH